MSTAVTYAITPPTSLVALTEYVRDTFLRHHNTVKLCCVEASQMLALLAERLGCEDVRVVTGEYNSWCGPESHAHVRVGHWICDPTVQQFADPTSDLPLPLVCHEASIDGQRYSDYGHSNWLPDQVGDEQQVAERLRPAIFPGGLYQRRLTQIAADLGLPQLAQLIAKLR